MTLGSFLREKRLALAEVQEGFGLRQLARRLDISPGSLSRLETDRAPRPVSAETLAILFEILELDRFEGFAIANEIDPVLMEVVKRPTRALATLLLEGRDCTDDDWRAALDVVRARRAEGASR